MIVILLYRKFIHNSNKKLVGRLFDSYEKVRQNSENPQLSREIEMIWRLQAWPRLLLLFETTRTGWIPDLGGYRTSIIAGGSNIPRQRYKRKKVDSDHCDQMWNILNAKMGNLGNGVAEAFERIGHAVIGESSASLQKSSGARSSFQWGGTFFALWVLSFLYVISVLVNFMGFSYSVT